MLIGPDCEQPVAVAGNEPLDDQRRRAGCQDQQVPGLAELNQEHRAHHRPSAAHIHEIVTSIGNEPNPTAANLGRQQTHTIGVLAPHLTDTVIAMHDKETPPPAQAGQRALVSTSHNEPELERDTSPVPLARRVARGVLSQY
ncbi:MAG TPA: hypothetical protein VEF89_15205 [Solirubrobacteraceae bacterium]|nr:hypothetical protein [Solirubrobacteraceae bacterium]